MKIALCLLGVLLVGFVVGWRSAFAFARHLLKCEDEACVNIRNRSLRAEFPGVAGLEQGRRGASSGASRVPTDKGKNK
jgi:hypothetical protein